MLELKHSLNSVDKSYLSILKFSLNDEVHSWFSRAFEDRHHFVVMLCVNIDIFLRNFEEVAVASCYGIVK